MREIKINDKIWQMPENFEEMTLDTFLKITNVQENNSEAIFKELYLIKLLEALVGAEPGELDDITLEDLSDITKGMDFLNHAPEPTETKHLEINGVTYMFPQNFNKLTAGEYISIKTLSEGQSSSNIILSLLSVILRPAKKVIDEETGKEKWIQNRFDAENLEHRRNIFLKLPVLRVLWAVNFFLASGNPT